MTVEREAPSEALATPIARDGRNGIAPLNVAQPSNGNDHHISEHVSERVAELVDQLTLEVVHLRITQRSNRRIGMAMGIVMNQLHVDDSQAFDTLCRISQNTNRKLRDIADDVITQRRI